LKEVIKKWGKEVIIVNEPEYCGKLLYVDKGASGSLHYHPKKKETFYLLEGMINLEYDDALFKMFESLAGSITLLPNTVHRFTAILDSILLEISTYHDDDDVVRLEPSRSANE